MVCSHLPQTHQNQLLSLNYSPRNLSAMVHVWCCAGGSSVWPCSWQTMQLQRESEIAQAVSLRRHRESSGLHSIHCPNISHVCWHDRQERNSLDNSKHAAALNWKIMCCCCCGDTFEYCKVYMWLNGSKHKMTAKSCNSQPFSDLIKTWLGSFATQQILSMQTTW